MIKNLKCLKRNIRTIEDSIQDVHQDETGLLKEYKENMLEVLNLELVSSRKKYANAKRVFLFVCSLILGLVIMVGAIFAPQSITGFVIISSYLTSLSGTILVSLNVREVDSEKTRNLLYALFALPVTIYVIGISMEVLHFLDII